MKYSAMVSSSSSMPITPPLDGIAAGLEHLGWCLMRQVASVWWRRIRGRAQAGEVPSPRGSGPPSQQCPSGVRSALQARARVPSGRARPGPRPGGHLGAGGARVPAGSLASCPRGRHARRCGSRPTCLSTWSRPPRMPGARSTMRWSVAAEWQVGRRRQAECLRLRGPGRGVREPAARRGWRERLVVEAGDVRGPISTQGRSAHVRRRRPSRAGSGPGRRPSWPGRWLPRW